MNTATQTRPTLAGDISKLAAWCNANGLGGPLNYFALYLKGEEPAIHDTKSRNILVDIMGKGVKYGSLTMAQASYVKALHAKVVGAPAPEGTGWKKRKRTWTAAPTGQTQTIVQATTPTISQADVAAANAAVEAAIRERETQRNMLREEYAISDWVRQERVLATMLIIGGGLGHRYGQDMNGNIYRLNAETLNKGWSYVVEGTITGFSTDTVNDIGSVKTTCVKIVTALPV